ncbi:hypothetical protein BDV96DRAFT_652618 [Lophiotrema nucula]|uniref:Uncharacterized protein n=1 Tax=Lophiotrema nucula TaxID=690887 RepID=A0A6A5YNW9_9PLEO|nr:hypothetical protein BDV96DRAFT_652618 [Lophiotrema nucula]
MDKKNPVPNFFDYTIRQSLIPDRAIPTYLALKRIEECTDDTATLNVFLDELKTLMRRDPSSREWVTTFGDVLIGELSVVAECLQLLMMQAWGIRVRTSASRNKSSLARELVQSQKGWISVMETEFRGMIPDSTVDEYNDAKFHGFSSNHRKKENIDAMRKAEESLDKFWQKVDTWFKKKTVEGYHHALQSLLDDNGSLKRTAPWVEPSRSQCTNAHAKDYSIYQPLSRILHDETKEITGKFSKTSTVSSVKAKTRGSTSVSETDQEGQPHAGGKEFDEEEVFTVTKSAFKVFETLFHSPTNADIPGQIKWMTFVEALAELGFSGEKTTGSIWRFSPVKIQLERGISFHEPHPDPKIPYPLARRIGRRLNRAYGWDISKFRHK